MNSMHDYYLQDINRTVSTYNQFPLLSVGMDNKLFNQLMCCSSLRSPSRIMFPCVSMGLDCLSECPYKFSMRICVSVKRTCLSARARAIECV